jgi:hypothetical protein
MEKVFSEFSDVITYFDNNEVFLGNKFIYMRQCVFNFDLDLMILITALKERYDDIGYLDFRESTFNCQVDLFEINQTPIYDELNNIEDYIYSKTKIPYTLDFLGCQFNEIVTFTGVEFCGDLNLNKTKFYKEVKISDLVFKKYIRLTDAIFYSDVYFTHLELNKKAIFFTTETNRVKFEGNLFFFNVDFHQAKFWDFVFTKDVYFQNTVFHCPAFFNNTQFLGKLTFLSFETIGLTEFKNKVYFDNSTINELILERLVFDNLISFNHATIKNASIDNVHCSNIPLSLVGTKIDYVRNEGTARFLKNEAMKTNNPFLVADLNAKEMNLHFHDLKWKTDFFDKMILLLNKISTNFGEKWQKGVLFIFLSWIISFSLIIMLRDGFGGTFIWFDRSYIRESMNFLWQFGSLDVLGYTYGWLDLFAFILGKMFIIYGVYQTIAAFRKYGKK